MSELAVEAFTVKHLLLSTTKGGEKEQKNSDQVNIKRYAAIQVSGAKYYKDVLQVCSSGIKPSEAAAVEDELNTVGFSDGGGSSGTGVRLYNQTSAEDCEQCSRCRSEVSGLKTPEDSEITAIGGLKVNVSVLTQ